MLRSSFILKFKILGAFRGTISIRRESASNVSKPCAHEFYFGWFMLLVPYRGFILMADSRLVRNRFLPLLCSCSAGRKTCKLRIKPLRWRARALQKSGFSISLHSIFSWSSKIAVFYVRECARIMWIFDYCIITLECRIS